MKIPKVLETGFIVETEQPNGKFQKFVTQEHRIKKWDNYDDVIIFGMTGWEFFYSETLASDIDPTQMTIELKGQAKSGVMERSRYAFANVFEELDTKGEYFIDKNTGMLYLYPTKDMTNATVKISTLDISYIIKATDCSYTTFDGLGFELTKGSAIKILGGTDCIIKNCTFKNLGISGINVGEGVISTRDLQSDYVDKGYFSDEIMNMITTEQNGVNHKVIDCTFLNTGYQAADIKVGHTGFRESGNMNFEGNIVKHTGILGGSYFSGVVLNGTGITVKNNAFLYSRGTGY